MILFGSLAYDGQNTFAFGAELYHWKASLANDFHALWR